MPPATLRQKRAQETRQLILDAAYGVFSDQGYGQASVDAIVSAAGISKGAFYHHFDSKEQLFNALLEDRVRDCAERMSEATSPARSLHEAVENLTRVGIEAYEGDPAWFRLFIEFWLQATREPSARLLVARSMSHCRELVAGMLKSGQASGAVRAELDPDTAAAILIGVFDGVMLQAAVDPQTVPLREISRHLTDLIERFIQSPADTPTLGRRTP